MKKNIFRFLANLLAHKNLYFIKSLVYLKRRRRLPISIDYVRYSSLELCGEEVIKRSLPGSVAELGVFRGDFSKRLNVLFPDKKLYLFDTFEGFSEDDVRFEKAHDYSTGSQDFTRTSVELVRSKMKYPQNCVFKKGKFPDTAVGVDEQFCFVSLDADLFQPIYEGLTFFYPRLVAGGYIFIHDFNNDQYPGARQAVSQFCTEQHIGLVPIPDAGGTVIITKGFA